MSDLALRRWMEHLRAVASPADAAPEAMARLDPSLRRAIGARSGGGAAPVPTPASEAGLWWAVADARVAVEPLLGRESDGPLFAQSRFTTIEVWTEAELCGLHALAGVARQRGRDDLRRRASSCREWHVRHTQPDNATNRPWALHVFLLDGGIDAPESRHYAETLLSNAMTTGPEPLSAWILLDAASELEKSLDAMGPAPGRGERDVSAR